ncbi:MAG: thymidylate synthase [Patescibacteria group bacterium]
MTTFDTIYQNLIRKIMNEGIEELNERTGHKIKILPGLTFQTDIEKDGFPVLTLRKNPIKSPIAEQVWFLTGDKNTEFLRKYTKMWDEFLEEDGTISSAYGYRWRHHFGRDQLDQLIKHLIEEPHSRQAVVITWDPSDDGLYGKELKATYKKNVPCPFAFTINIIGGRLHMHNIVRSNDMMLGCPFDTFGFSLLMCTLAQKLGVRPGVYTHTISNAHIYDIHYDGANELIKRSNDHQNIFPILPKDIYDRGLRKDETLVDEIYQAFSPYFKPSEPITGLDIVI